MNAEKGLSAADRFEVRQGLPGSLLGEAAALYDEAFGPKLRVAIPDAKKRQTMLKDSFDPAFCLVALEPETGQLAGLVGFQNHGGGFTKGQEMTFARIRKLLGLWGALRASMILTLYSRLPEGDQWVLDGITVSANHRGQGLGTRLLEGILKLAQAQGAGSVRLDVIAENPRARALYERMGFEAHRQHSTGFLSRWLGFTAATTLLLRFDG